MLLSLSHPLRAERITLFLCRPPQTIMINSTALSSLRLYSYIKYSVQTLFSGGNIRFHMLSVESYGAKTSNFGRRGLAAILNHSLHHPIYRLFSVATIIVNRRERLKLIYLVAEMNSTKPVCTLIIDTGAIIKNDPSVSSLLAKAENLVTVPAIISEIKDVTTRSRVESTLQPFLTLRSPRADSIKFVTDFARKTGDLAVLSTPDIQIIALAYEIECERNGGDWRLRKVPGQKGLNGAPPVRSETSESPIDSSNGGAHPFNTSKMDDSNHQDASQTQSSNTEGCSAELPNSALVESSSKVASESEAGSDDLPNRFSSVRFDGGEMNAPEEDSPSADLAQSYSNNPSSSQEESGSESDGWITPSNLKKRQAQDATSSTIQSPEPSKMQVGILTTDFAMQNVILQINLNLLSPTLTRVKHLKTFVLRCHACFQVTKDMSKQFCPKCGQPTLTRVSCSTNSNGEFKLHLKKNMQWNTRGDRYSIPKPVHGSANGKMKGGGKKGWGNELLLSEDQKEYERAVKSDKKQKERNLMDEDYLPSILTGDRGRTGGRIKVGAGRNVNAKKC